MTKEMKINRSMQARCKALSLIASKTNGKIQVQAYNAITKYNSSGIPEGIEIIPDFQDFSSELNPNESYERNITLLAIAHNNEIEGLDSNPEAWQLLLEFKKKAMKIIITRYHYNDGKMDGKMDEAEELYYEVAMYLVKHILDIDLAYGIASLEKTIEFTISRIMWVQSKEFLYNSYEGLFGISFQKKKKNVMNVLRKKGYNWVDDISEWNNHVDIIRKVFGEDLGNTKKATDAFIKYIHLEYVNYDFADINGECFDENNINNIEYATEDAYNILIEQDAIKNNIVYKAFCECIAELPDEEKKILFCEKNEDKINKNPPNYRYVYINRLYSQFMNKLNIPHYGDNSDLVKEFRKDVLEHTKGAKLSEILEYINKEWNWSNRTISDLVALSGSKDNKAYIALCTCLKLDPDRKEYNREESRIIEANINGLRKGKNVILKVKKMLKVLDISCTEKNIDAFTKSMVIRRNIPLEEWLDYINKNWCKK